MKFLNRFGFLWGMGCFLFILCFIPRQYQELYVLGGGSLGMFLFYLLLKKRVPITAINDSEKTHILFARYVGNLSLLLAVLLALGTLASFISPALTHSWIMMLVVLPIMLYIPFAFYKLYK